MPFLPPSFLPRSLARLLDDPPPEFVFEFAPDAVRMARSDAPGEIQTASLPPGIISPSPLHDNIALIEPLNEAVLKLLPPTKSGKRRTAALLLPDHCAHVAVLDFDNFPDKPDEQVSLIRFRLKRSVPFDVETAAMSYWVQDPSAAKASQPAAASVAPKNRREVLVAVTPFEIVGRYEAPLRFAGLHPGMVSLSQLACLDLVPTKGAIAVARLSGDILSIVVVSGGIVKVIRSLELAARDIDEIVSDLHQTFVYAEDSIGALPSQLLVAGFAELEPEALRELPAEFHVPVDVLGGTDTGIRGYLMSYMKTNVKGTAAA